MTLLNTLMETYATLSQKVAQLEQDKIAQVLEILKLKRRVKKLEKMRRSKSSSLKKLRKGRKDDDNAATKDVSAAEPTVFDDEENAVAEQIQEKHLGNIIKYRSLKRKPISIAHARKNIIIYLKNMAGYKMEHFECMTYDKKKRVAEETLLQERFKKLKAVEVSVSELKVEALQVKYLLIDWEIHSKGSRSYWKIIRVGGITEAYQSFEYMLKGFDKEDLDALWRLVKEKFSSAMPT
nr:hypothetical protein [Tanacetum cinerariifolium]